MISKELISEVLQIPETVKNIWVNEANENNINYQLAGDGISTINIYELEHKCKVWSLSMGYDIITVEIENKYCILAPDSWQKGTKDKVDMRFIVSDTFKPQETEAEAVFKACQWLYDL